MTVLDKTKKPYVCAHCNASYVQQTSLNYHVVLHHGGAAGSKGGMDLQEKGGSKKKVTGEKEVQVPYVRTVIQF